MQTVCGGGGHLNTSSVHMHDQRFSKYTLSRYVPLGKTTPKQELSTIFSPDFNPLNKIFFFLGGGKSTFGDHVNQGI